jgi:hypothetical protein
MVDRRRRLYIHIIPVPSWWTTSWGGWWYTRMHMCVWCLRIFSYVCHVCIKPFVYMSGVICVYSLQLYFYIFLNSRSHLTLNSHSQTWHRPTRPPTRHGRCCYPNPNIKNTRLKTQSQLRFGQNGFTNQIKTTQCLLKVAAAARRPRQCFFVKEWLWRWWWRGWSWQWWWWQ